MKKVTLNISGKRVELPLPAAIVIGLIAIAVVGLSALFGGGGELADDESSSKPETSVVGETTEKSAVSTAETAQTLSFRSDKLLEEHYNKHGVEMGFSSAKEYEAAAAAVVNSSEALHKTEAEDGDDVYYIEATNEFVVVSTDGYIRTYFLPDRGKAYFDKQ